MLDIQDRLNDLTRDIVNEFGKKIGKISSEEVPQGYLQSFIIETLSSLCGAAIYATSPNDDDILKKTIDKLTKRINEKFDITMLIIKDKINGKK